jgi:hypothetical protein
MAQELRAEGEEVALLALINCMPRNSSYDRIRVTPVFCLKFLRNLFYWSNYVLHLKRGRRREFLRWKLLALKKKLLHIARPSGVAPLDFDIEDFVDLSAQPEGRRSLWETHVKALFRHTPQPYDGPVTLFRTRGHSAIRDLMAASMSTRVA